MTMFNTRYYALYLFSLFLIGGAVSCKGKDSQPVEITNNNVNMMADTIIDPIPSSNCDLRLRQKEIIISFHKNFPVKSRGKAIINVVISSDGKIDSCMLIYLRIMKENKELYLFNQPVRNNTEYPKEIEFIINSLTKELQRAIITCKKGNDEETRLRIPVDIKFE